MKITKAMGRAAMRGKWDAVSSADAIDAFRELGWGVDRNSYFNGEQHFYIVCALIMAIAGVKP